MASLPQPATLLYPADSLTLAFSWDHFVQNDNESAFDNKALWLLVCNAGYKNTEDSTEKTSMADHGDSRLIFLNQQQYTKFCSNRVRWEAVWNMMLSQLYYIDQGTSVTHETVFRDILYMAMEHLYSYSSSRVKYTIVCKSQTVNYNCESFLWMVTTQNSCAAFISMQATNHMSLDRSLASQDKETAAVPSLITVSSEEVRRKNWTYTYPVPYHMAHNASC